jgi:hypothetical protein
MSEHPSPLDRLEARLDAQAARIDELYRLLQEALPRPETAGPRRRPRRRRDRVATRS